MYIWRNHCLMWYTVYLVRREMDRKDVLAIDKEPVVVVPHIPADRNILECSKPCDSQNLDRKDLVCIHLLRGL